MKKNIRLQLIFTSSNSNLFKKASIIDKCCSLFSAIDFTSLCFYLIKIFNYSIEKKKSFCVTDFKLNELIALIEYKFICSLG